MRQSGLEPPRAKRPTRPSTLRVYQFRHWREGLRSVLPARGPADTTRMRRHVNNIWTRWPKLAIFGCFSLIIGVLVWIPGLLSNLDADANARWSSWVFLFMATALACLVVSVSDVTGDAERRKDSKRGYAMSRVSWLVHPPTYAGYRPGNITASIPKYRGLGAIAYLLFVPLLVVWRSLKLLFVRPPRVGDLVSIELPGIPRNYALVVLEAETETEFTIRTLLESPTRKRSLRIEEVNRRTPTREIARSALKASSPRFVWRDELGFFNPEPEESGSRGIR
jgi:hypothetical protein